MLQARYQLAPLGSPVAGNVFRVTPLASGMTAP
jgi:hypothetical protein